MNEENVFFINLRNIFFFLFFFLYSEIFVKTIDAVASVGTAPEGNVPFTNVGSPICVWISEDQNIKLNTSDFFKNTKTVFEIV